MWQGVAAQRVVGGARRRRGGRQARYHARGQAAHYEGLVQAGSGARQGAVKAVVIFINWYQVGVWTQKVELTSCGSATLAIPPNIAAVVRQVGTVENGMFGGV